ncbi:MAG: cytochrome oxidase small assembly protein [Rubrivivax sp.]
MPTEEQRRANVRLGLILATVALVFALGFVLKIVWMRG